VEYVHGGADGGTQVAVGTQLRGSRASDVSEWTMRLQSAVAATQTAGLAPTPWAVGLKMVQPGPKWT
jgi:hypothetical protein